MPMEELLQGLLVLVKLPLAIMELFRRAIEQAPAEDGVRYTRGLRSFAKLLNSLKILSLKNARIGSRATAARASGKSQKARST